jgi:hypothetical protein
MTRYSLKVPQFQVFIGSEDISEAVVGYSFHHPLAEPSTPLIWTGTIEMFPARSGHPRSFFDDEANPSRWLSGLQPIDVYFNGTWWQRFRIKPSGYRYNQDNGQAEIEITDIIGILDSYASSADTPEFKTGGNNYWNDLAVALIKKQAAIMGTTVTVETPPMALVEFTVYRDRSMAATSKKLKKWLVNAAIGCGATKKLSNGQNTLPTRITSYGANRVESC